MRTNKPGSVTPIDHFFENGEEPVKAVFTFLRKSILAFDPCITESWKYGMPFYNYKAKRSCYLWYHKKNMHRSVGFANGHLIAHPMLVLGTKNE